MDLRRKGSGMCRPTLRFLQKSREAVGNGEGMMNSRFYRGMCQRIRVKSGILGYTPGLSLAYWFKGGMKVIKRRTWFWWGK